MVLCCFGFFLVSCARKTQINNLNQTGKDKFYQSAWEPTQCWGTLVTACHTFSVCTRVSEFELDCYCSLDNLHLFSPLVPIVRYCLLPHSKTKCHSFLFTVISNITLPPFLFIKYIELVARTHFEFKQKWVGILASVCCVPIFVIPRRLLDFSSLQFSHRSNEE